MAKTYSITITVTGEESGAAYIKALCDAFCEVPTPSDTPISVGFELSVFDYEEPESAPVTEKESTEKPREDHKRDAILEHRARKRRRKL